MDDLWQRLIEQWRGGGTNLQRGADPSEIAQFETSHRVRLPADVRAYFEAVNGTGRDMANDMFRFWPLAEFRRVEDVLGNIHPDRNAYPDCFVFADYCIDCWYYAVRIVTGAEQSGPVFRVTGGDPPGEKLNGSFREFIESYLADSDKVL